MPSSHGTPFNNSTSPPQKKNNTTTNNKRHTPLLSAQIERYFAKSWQVPKFGDGAVSDWINKKSNQLAKVTAVPFYQRFQHYCGSSAGATALVGFDAGLAGKAVLRVCMIAQRCSAQHWIAQFNAA